MARKITTHLMFEGVAEEAMNFYVSLFPGSTIVQIERYAPGEPGAEGTFKRATFALGGQEFLCFDSPVKHDFTFTPSISLFVECESEAEIEELFSARHRILLPALISRSLISRSGSSGRRRGRRCRPAARSRSAAAPRGRCAW